MFFNDPLLKLTLVNVLQWFLSKSEGTAPRWECLPASTFRVCKCTSGNIDQ